MSVSFWGVDHGGEVSKAAPAAPAQPKQKTPTGRLITGGLFPGIHGAVAGKPGNKLRAAGNEYGGALLGGVAGAALTKGRAAGVGQVAGGMLGTDRAQKKGYFKPYNG